jgi:ubiquinone/menaquinone biosynthesis C-methylase UbiE
VDAKAMNYSDEMFDAVISNSIIHHIPDPEKCLAEVVRVTRPGGLIFFRDLLRPRDRKTLMAQVQQYCGAEAAYAQQLFADSLHAALTLDEVRRMVHELGFPESSVIASSDRHWTWSAFKIY